METAGARTRRIGALTRLTAAFGLAPHLSVETEPATYLVLIAGDIEKAAAGNGSETNVPIFVRSG